jgi:hypothetical protein
MAFDEGWGALWLVVAAVVLVEEDAVGVVELGAAAVVVWTMKSTIGDKKCATQHCTAGSLARRSEIC